MNIPYNFFRMYLFVLNVLQELETFQNEGCWYIANYLKVGSIAVQVLMQMPSNIQCLHFFYI